VAKINVSLDTQDILDAALTRGKASATATPHRGPGPVNQLIRIAQEEARLRLAGPVDPLLQTSLELRRAEAIRSLKRQENAVQHPSLHALSGLRLGAGLFESGGGVGAFAHIAGNLGQFSTLIKALGGPVTAAVVGVGALGAAAVAASKSLIAISQTGHITGGTPGEVVQGRALAGLAGVSPDSFAALAQGLRQRIATGGLARQAASEMGFGFIAPTGIGTPPNMAKIMLQAVESLRGMTEPQARLAAERLPELQPFLVLRDATDEQMKEFRQLAQEMGRLATPEARQAALGLRLETEKLSLEWEKLTVNIGTKVLPAVTTLAKAANVAMEAPWWAKSGPVGSAAYGIYKLFHRGKDKEEDADTKTMGETVREQMRTMKEHSAEMRNHTQAMRTEGTFGGGSRAQTGIPPGLRGEALAQALRVQAIRLGAF
jgi:hypothetical protein